MVESRTQGSRPTPIRTQKKNSRPRTALPRTDPLEAKDRNARGQGPRTQVQVFSKQKSIRDTYIKDSTSGNSICDTCFCAGPARGGIQGYNIPGVRKDQENNKLLIDVHSRSCSSNSVSRSLVCWPKLSKKSFFSLMRPFLVSTLFLAKAGRISGEDLFLVR